MMSKAGTNRARVGGESVRDKSIMTPLEAVRAALLLYASDKEFAEAIGYSANAVSLIKRGRRVSAKMAVAIEYATNGKVRRQWLAPEVYGKARLLPEARQGQLGVRESI